MYRINVILFLSFAVLGFLMIKTALQRSHLEDASLYRIQQMEKRNNTTVLSNEITIRNCQKSSGEIYFKFDGVFHSPTPENFKKRFNLPVTAGQEFTRICIALDVTIGSWYLNDEGKIDGNHSIFWLHRDKRWAGNLLGYVNIFGPEKNFLKMSTNIDLPKGKMHANKKNAVFQENQTYHFEYIYDTQEGIYKTVVQHKRKIFVQVQDSTTVEKIISKEPGFFLVFGHSDDEAGPEVPTIGWKYANLVVKIIP
jgi:hypothetical protein